MDYAGPDGRDLVCKKVMVDDMGVSGTASGAIIVYKLINNHVHRK